MHRWNDEKGRKSGFGKWVGKGTLLVVTTALLVALSACGGGKSSEDGKDAKPAATDSTAKDGKEAAKPPVEILNVSYDPTRELYEKYNKAFAAHWEQQTGQKVTIKQSHGGSGKQARSVADGLEADVVTLALGYDVDAIQKAGLINEGWQSKLQDNSTPYTSTIVFLVRAGNPKGIKDWDDLIKPGVEIITPNPKTSGGARWNYVAAWGYALKHNNNDENAARDFVSKLYKNVISLDSGARDATNKFVQSGLGDVLLAWENEAFLSVNELGKDKFEIVVPSYSVLAEPPVAVVDKVVDKKGTREVAQAYLEYLYSEEGQTIAAENYYRPRLQSVADKFAAQFPKLELFTIDDPAFGGWKATQEKHFSDKGVFDQIYKPGQ